MGASESTALDVGKDAVFIPWKDGQSSAVAPQPTKKPAKQPATPVGAPAYALVSPE